MNDIFYFMEICDLVNYADDNTLVFIRNTIQLVWSVLKKDAENAVIVSKIIYVHEKIHK